ncbi:MAG: hypothetical protein SFY80_06940 [Verrucomicrobiota bacterium]|nr:hypothetical protein [Verrucomicrobiota bacterium]
MILDWGSISKYAGTFITGLVVVWMLTPLFIRLGPILGLMDVPGGRRIHKHPTPRSGGLAVVLGFHAAVLSIYFLFWPDFFGLLNKQWWGHFAIASSVLVLVGLVDDRWGMRAWIKLSGQIVAVGLYVYLDGSTLGHVFGVNLPMSVDIIITVLWCLLIINAFNLIDGLDGLCAGLAFIAALGMAGVYLLRGNAGDSLIGLALAGAALGFIRYNFHPARIFLGDSGSMFFGFVIAVMAVESAGKSTALVSIGIPFLAAGVPVIDTVLAVWRRSMRKISARAEGDKHSHAIMGADKAHLHHRLLSLGMNQRKVAFALYGLNVTLVGIALLITLRDRLTVGLGFMIFIVVAVMLVRHLVAIEVWETGKVVITGLKRPGIRNLSRVLLPFTDLVSIAVAVLLSGLLSGREDYWSYDKQQWLVEIVTWAGPVFLFLGLGRSYARIWSQAVFKDFLMLFFSLTAGTLLSAVLIAFQFPEHTEYLLGRSCIFLLIAQLGIFSLRGVRLLANESMRFAEKSRTTDSGKAVRTILIYGVDSEADLLVRHLQSDSEHGDTLHICGFFVDDIRFQHRYAFGFPVLGSTADLPGIISSHQVTEIILAAPVDIARQETIRTIAATTGVQVSRWVTKVERIT